VVDVTNEYDIQVLFFSHYNFPPWDGCVGRMGGK